MILVTGARGLLAGRIIEHLRTAGADVLTASRNPGEGGRAMDFDVRSSLDLSDVTTLVLVSAGYAEDDVVIQRHGSVVEAARRQGVTHIVYTSLVGAGDHLAFALAHRATERLIRESGLKRTMLRNGLYAELIGGMLSGREGSVESPFAGGRVAAPTRDDLAVAAASVAIQADTHAGRTYELTGPSFTVADIAAELGVPVRDLTLEAYRKGLLDDPGLLPFQPPMLAGIATAVRHGFLSEQGPDLAELLGRAPVRGLAAAAGVAALEVTGT